MDVVVKPRDNYFSAKYIHITAIRLKNIMRLLL